MTDDTAGNADALELRRRRAHYRAHHRGTKEMDWLVGRYAEAHLEGMTEPELAHFERFLALPDPELQKWLLDPVSLASNEFGPLVVALRRYHGL